MALTLEEKFELTELIHRINYIFDARDFEALASHLTANFTVVVPEGVFEREPYIELMKDIKTKIATQHWSGNILIEGDGDRAMAKTYVLCPEGPRSDGSYGVFIMGTIDYSAVRVEGRWLFDKFTIERDQTFEVPG